MKSFEYVARNLSGELRRGLRQAVCANDVLSWLREQGITPVSVDEITTVREKKRRIRHKKSIKSAEMSALCWQLSTMVEGGISITTALEIVADDIDNLHLQEVLQQILKRVQKGEAFSESLMQFPHIFNRLACAIILAGESSGDLSDSLQRLAQHYENRDKLARKVKGAMAYPAFVFIFIILIVAFIMGFIIPRFRAIFDQIGGELPAFTQAFMNFYDVVCANILYIIGTVFFVVIAAVLIHTRSQKGHYLFCKIVLRVPLLGKIISQAFIATFCRIMSTLLGSGISVLEVFDILSGMTGNDIIKSAVTKTRQHVVEGSNISLSMAAAGFFPNMVVKMVQVGEESGSLPNVLGKTSNYYERKVDALISTVMSLLEPIMIVTVGGVVLVVVLALYLPIFSMSQ